MSDAWKPQDKQELALKTVAFEILYGGARGGGKTDCGMVWMLKGVGHPRFRGLVIRKNADDLRDWIARARVMYSAMGAEVVGQPPEVRFPSGATIVTGHLKDENAYEKYQGHEYQRILLEELTQIPDEERYLKLISSCRSTIEIDPRVFCTSNPLGVGHAWVKKRFVDLSVNDGEVFEDPKTGRTRCYIPATIEDNPILMRRDPEYRSFLTGLPDQLRKAWLEGSWEVMVGMYFEDLERSIHLYKPKDVEILDYWPRFVSIDWGYKDPMAVYWHAVGPDQHIYTYREMYESGLLDIEAAKKVLELTGKEKIEYYVGDPSSFPVTIPHLKYGKIQPVKRFEVWGEAGISILMGENDRISGWSRMRQYLRPRDYMGKKSSWWHISTECPQLWSELSTAIYDKRIVEDIAPNCLDHALDSCRYGLMSRPPLWVEKERELTELEAAEKYWDRQRENENC